MKLSGMKVWLTSFALYASAVFAAEAGKIVQNFKTVVLVRDSSKEEEYKVLTTGNKLNVGLLDFQNMSNTEVLFLVKPKNLAAIPAGVQLTKNFSRANVEGAIQAVADAVSGKNSEGVSGFHLVCADDNNEECSLDVFLSKKPAIMTLSNLKLQGAETAEYKDEMSQAVWSTPIDTNDGSEWTFSSGGQVLPAGVSFGLLERKALKSVKLEGKTPIGQSVTSTLNFSCPEAIQVANTILGLSSKSDLFYAFDTSYGCKDVESIVLDCNGTMTVTHLPSFDISSLVAVSKLQDISFNTIEDPSSMTYALACNFQGKDNIWSISKFFESKSGLLSLEKNRVFLTFKLARKVGNSLTCSTAQANMLKIKFALNDMKLSKLVYALNTFVFRKMYQTSLFTVTVDQQEKTVEFWFVGKKASSTFVDFLKQVVSAGGAAGVFEPIVYATTNTGAQWEETRTAIAAPRPVVATVKPVATTPKSEAVKAAEPVKVEPIKAEEPEQKVEPVTAKPEMPAQQRQNTLHPRPTDGTWRSSRMDAKKSEPEQKPKAETKPVEQPNKAPNGQQPRRNGGQVWAKKEEAKKLEEAKNAEETRKLEETMRLKELKRIEEAKRFDEMRRLEEVKRLEQEKAKKAEELKKLKEEKIKTLEKAKSVEKTAHESFRKATAAFEQQNTLTKDLESKKATVASATSEVKNLKEQLESNPVTAAESKFISSQQTQTAADEKLAQVTNSEEAAIKKLEDAKKEIEDLEKKYQEALKQEEARRAALPKPIFQLSGVTNVPDNIPSGTKAQIAKKTSMVEFISVPIIKKPDNFDSAIEACLLKPLSLDNWIEKHPDFGLVHPSSNDSPMHLLPEQYAFWIYSGEAGKTYKPSSFGRVFAPHELVDNLESLHYNASYGAVDALVSSAPKSMLGLFKKTARPNETEYARVRQTFAIKEDKKDVYLLNDIWQYCMMLFVRPNSKVSANLQGVSVEPLSETTFRITYWWPLSVQALEAQSIASELAADAEKIATVEGFKKSPVEILVNSKK